MKAFFEKIKRHKVWQVALVYVAVAWGLVQVADTVLPMFDTPGWVLKTFTVLLALGFPVAVLLAWASDNAPSGGEHNTPLRPGGFPDRRLAAGRCDLVGTARK